MTRNGFIAQIVSFFWNTYYEGSPSSLKDCIETSSKLVDTLNELFDTLEAHGIAPWNDNTTKLPKCGNPECQHCHPHTSQPNE